MIPGSTVREQKNEIVKRGKLVMAELMNRGLQWVTEAQSHWGPFVKLYTTHLIIFSFYL
jgi:hypothetical protein